MSIHRQECQLTQNAPVVFVVNSMVMTFLGAGYSNWGADTAIFSFWTIQRP